MKLANIYMAREAWQRLALLRMPPHTAFRILKYSRQLDAESTILEQQRVKILREVSGIAEGDIDAKNFPPNSIGQVQFATSFNELLQADSDLKPFIMTLPGLLDLLGKEQGNVLSAQDLAQLEPFFEEPTE